jgi:hypothetical protein
MPTASNPYATIKGVMYISLHAYGSSKSLSIKKEDFNMVNSQNFEVPDFCATDTRQCSLCGSIPPTAPVCNANYNFGCLYPAGTESCCHDICVEDVRLVALLPGNTCEFTECFAYPPIGRCRLPSDITLPFIDTATPPRVFVACAQETLDSASCQVINVVIEILVLARTTLGSSILIPLTLNATFDTFFAFPDCTTPISGAALQNELTKIDGSCLVVQLGASYRTVSGGVQIVITGRIIDKLWKHENLWIEARLPYTLSDTEIANNWVSFTIPDIFNHQHKLTPCGSIGCP